jgi:hypothetical protein
MRCIGKPKIVSAPALSRRSSAPARAIKNYMKARYLSLFACAFAATVPAQVSPVSTDLWDVTRGAVITADSGIMSGAGSHAGLLGENGQNINDGATFTYFNDFMPMDFVHYVEWEVPANVTIGNVRVFAYGDEENNYAREFHTFKVMAKSPGSATYDITVVDYTATHPFAFLAAGSWLIVDEVVAPVTARQFRAEFTQADSGTGSGFDGPRIVEIDGLPVPRPTVNIPSTNGDVFDVSSGTIVTSTSGIHPGAGTLTGLFGNAGQSLFDANTFTYFADGMPSDTVHFVEFETPGYVSLTDVRLYAYGDGEGGFPNLNNGREFDQFTLKAKSAGSSTYDVTVVDFTPTHPFENLDPSHYLILNQSITPVTARYFRAEFLQYTAGNAWDGPRIVELDGIGVAVPPPSDPPPSDPPPSDPPPSDPPPSDPPPSDPPPTTPVPPVISAQPQSVTANYAMPVALTVQATVTGTAHYQWYKDGAALEGQTFETLWIPSLAAANTGVYHATVTDDVATVASSTATVALETARILPAGFDLWDAHLGSTITAMTPYVGVPNGMFGAGSAAESTDATYFADGALGATHVVEWATPTAVQVNTIRLFANGDGAREFGSFTLRAKSAGSATFDILVGTFTPSHPYTLLDESSYAILDTEIAPITATAFRAEFTQTGSSGPRVLELDAFTTRPLVMPAVVVDPVSQIAQKGQDLTLEVLARGGSLTYQWKRNGVALPGQTSASLTIAGVKKPDEGSYSVVVSNPLGTVESSPAILQVNTKPDKIRPPVK